jgi:molybdopterin converting factor small subunit
MNDSLLLQCFNAELLWNFKVTHLNTGNFRVEAVVTGILEDQTGVSKVNGDGATLGEAVGEVSEWLGRLVGEARGVAQRDLKRLDSVLGVSA